ncbi:MAG: hypothetical protein LBD78_01780 [Spirochaetaceae bacterium]|jgi:hypothetical protein|nr:hypothetical protein [Spirochaetaceae bacterium]
MIDGKRRLRRISGFWVIVWSLGAIVLPVYGAGRKAPPLAQADALIADKRYDAAIQVLTGYIRQNPENFPAVQRRFQQIIRLRDRYGALANEIPDVFEADRSIARQLLQDPRNRNSTRLLELQRRIESVL